MASFKAGVIGCGGRGKAHARGWTASDDVALVACADPFEAPRSAYMAEFGVENGYEDYRDMLEKEDLDFVSVYLDRIASRYDCRCGGQWDTGDSRRKAHGTDLGRSKIAISGMRR